MNLICVLFDKWGLTEKEGREILGCTLDEYQEMKQGKIEGFKNSNCFKVLVCR